jgi:hypothetical protein
VDSLIFVKGLIGVLVFLCAVGALLTQLQMRKRIPPIIRAQPKALRRWHHWFGRAALAGFVLNSTICSLIGLYPVPRTDFRHLAHSILAALCLLVFLAKGWITRLRIKWGMKHILNIGWLLFALQSMVFVSATVFAIWARFTGIV